MGQTKALPRIAPELSELPHVPVAALEPFQGNLKDLSEREYNKLKKSIQENGVIVPFFVWQEAGKLLDGHQRQRVFMREGWEMDVPVVYISAENEQDAKRKLLVISSQYGKITPEGWDEFTWDIEDDWLLDTVQFDGLPELFGDWPANGHPPEEPSDAEPQINRAEELREKWGVELGQLWRLPSRTPGQEHRLICGDCTDADVVERVIDIDCALMITDPPYGVEYDAAWRDRAAENGQLQFAAQRTGVVHNDDLVDWQAAIDLFGGDIIYLWHAGLHAKDSAVFLEKAGFIIRCQIIWSKPHFVIGRGHYHTRHEPCWYAYRKGKNAGWIGGRDKDTVWNITLDQNVDGGHSTQKPLECMARPMRNHAGDVYEPFSGSGTTIIAAENLSRQCRAVEIAPEYVAVALQRYEDAFGITPELVSSISSL